MMTNKQLCPPSPKYAKPYFVFYCRTMEKIGWINDFIMKEKYLGKSKITARAGQEMYLHLER